MFVITKAQRVRRDVERARRAYIESVRELHTEIFNLSPLDVAKQDKAWLEWLSVPAKVWQSDDSDEAALLALIMNTDVDESFRARALAGFFAPEARWIPFGWSKGAVTGESGYSYYSHRPYVFATGLRKRINGDYYLHHILEYSRPSSTLLSFVWNIVPLSVTAVRGATRGPHECWRRFGSYNEFILEALSKLSEDDPLALQLYESYELYDYPVCRVGKEKKVQLSRLLQSSVSEKWKVLADSAVRAMIVESDQTPVILRNAAVEGYKEAVYEVVQYHTEKLPYSLALFLSQVDFFIAHDLSVPIYNWVGSSYKAARDVLLLLEEDMALCHRFARNLVLTTGFLTQPDGLTAKRIWELFSEFDTELCEKLRPAMEKIATWDAGAAERGAEERTKKEEHAAALTRVLAHLK